MALSVLTSPNNLHLYGGIITADQIDSANFSVTSLDVDSLNLKNANKEHKLSVQSFDSEYVMNVDTNTKQVYIKNLQADNLDIGSYHPERLNLSGNNADDKLTVQNQDSDMILRVDTSANTVTVGGEGLTIESSGKCLSMKSLANQPNTVQIEADTENGTITIFNDVGGEATMTLQAISGETVIKSLLTNQGNQYETTIESRVDSNSKTGIDLNADNIMLSADVVIPSVGSLKVQGLATFEGSANSFKGNNFDVLAQDTSSLISTDGNTKYVGIQGSNLILPSVPQDTTTGPFRSLILSSGQVKWRNRIFTNMYTTVAQSAVALNAQSYTYVPITGLINTINNGFEIDSNGDIKYIGTGDSFHTSFVLSFQGTSTAPYTFCLLSPSEVSSSVQTHYASSTNHWFNLSSHFFITLVTGQVLKLGVKGSGSITLSNFSLTATSI